MIARFRARQPGAPLAAVLLHLVGKLLCAFTCTFLFRARAFGVERVPRRGAVLLASNHQSYIDPPLVGCFLRGRHADFVAREGLFRWAPFARVLVGVGATPVSEDGADASAIRQFLARLAMGRALVIFPEGSRSDDGRIGEFKRGVALLMKRAKCPVVPVAVEGCFDAWPRGGPVRPFRRVMVAYGEPIAPDVLRTLGPDGALARLRSEIEELRAGLFARLRRDSCGTYPPERRERPGPTPQNGNVTPA